MRWKTLNNAITIHNVSLNFLLNQVFRAFHLSFSLSSFSFFSMQRKTELIAQGNYNPGKIFFVPYRGSTITDELNEREALRSTVDTLPLPPTPNPRITLFNPVHG